MIAFDLNNLNAGVVGPRGLEASEIDNLSARAAGIHGDLQGRREAGSLPFYDLPLDKAALRRVLDLAGKLRARFDDVVLLGIGGSSLGAQALLGALADPGYNALDRARRGGPRLHFPDNIDPRHFQALLTRLEPRRTAFIVATKSGGTAETMSQFLVARSWAVKALGQEALGGHFLALTDPEKGSLRKIARAEGFATLDIPPGVGGRFSIFTPVGLLPAALAGIDCEKLLQGAALGSVRASRPEIWKNPAYLLAAAAYLLDRERGRPMLVFMPYAESLSATAEWFCQLWAESLGKRHDLQGREVCTGPTPIKAVGATDQHSQLQLYMEGPHDKTIMMLAVKRFDDALSLPAPPEGPGYDELAYLAGHDLTELLNAEQRATAVALTQSGRPNLTLGLEKLDASALGELLQILMVATAFAGGLYGINPFDQPGVELGKRYTYALMGRPGFETERQEIIGAAGSAHRSEFQLID